MRRAAREPITVDKIVFLGIDLTLALHTTEARGMEVSAQNMKHIHVLRWIGTTRSNTLDLALGHTFVLGAEDSAHKNNKGPVVLVVQELGTIGTPETVVMPAAGVNLHIALGSQRTETSIARTEKLFVLTTHTDSLAVFDDTIAVARETLATFVTGEARPMEELAAQFHRRVLRHNRLPTMTARANLTLGLFQTVRI